MSIHVCKCVHNGREEYHLRYPGMDEAQAQALADKINGGYLEKAFLKLLEEYEGVMEEFEYRSYYDKMVGFANEARTTLSLPTFEGKAK